MNLSLRSQFEFNPAKAAMKSQRWIRRAAWLASIALLLVLTPRGWAQENATITGTVMDSSGAVVPNAAITLTNPATSQVRQTISNSSGEYTFANVGVGHFTLTASVTGFQKFAKTDIVVNVAQTLQEDVNLTAGSQTETVTVAADALQVQSETSELSNLISGDQVTQLATNGRNVTSLAALGTGVSNTLSDFGGVNALTTSNAIQFNGTRVSHNIYLLDGGELNDRGCGGCFSSLPAIDALAEFQTLDSNYGPDYGIGSGGTIVMVLKSGAQKFHGELWEFNRNEDYDANNYFTNQAGKPRPKFRLNEPGGNIGGPVWIPHFYNEGRNKTFFFVNEEWRRLIQGSTPALVNNGIAASNFPTLGQDLHYTVPSNGAVPVYPSTYNVPAALQGQPFTKNSDGTYTIPASLIDQNAVLELNAGTFPKPNVAGSSSYISSIPQPTDVREDVVRIDHAINSKFQFMGHYLHDAVTQSYYPPLWGDSSYPTVGTAMRNPSWSSTLKLTQTYSPNLLNETTFLWSGNTINLDPIAGPGGSFVQPTGWTATSFFPVADNFLARLPEIDLGAPYSHNWSSSYYPWKNSYFGYEPKDDLSWTKGKHQFKFGFSWLHDPKNQQLQYNTNGTAVFTNAFSGDSYINFLLGDVSTFSQLQYLAGKHWVNDNYGFYGNDNWHVTPRLTLNLGLRYDVMPHAFERYNKFANFVPADYNTSLGNPVASDGTLDPASLTAFNGQQFYLNGIREANVGGFSRGVVQNDYKTVQPRVGFAYNVRGDGKTVVRGGFGLFYERVQGNDVYNAALNPPFAYIPQANNVSFSNPNTSVTTGVTTTQFFPSNLTNLKYKYSNPGTAQFSFGIQQQLAQSIVWVFQYAGSQGWDQSDDRAINTLPLTDPNNPSNPYGLRQGVAGKVPNPAVPGTFMPSLNPNLYRQYLGFSSIQQEENETNFTYHSLQTGLRMENRHGLTLQLAYTWSHAIDEVTYDLNSLSNPFNAKYDKGSGVLDRRHIFNANYIYKVPFFEHSSNLLERTTLGGWEISGITFAQTGTPQSIALGGADILGLGGGTNNRPNLVSKVTYPKKQGQWFSTASFAQPLAPWAGGSNQGFGTAPKDAVVLPGLFNFNLSLFKTIPLSPGEGPKLELRFESFNTFNHTEFSGIDSGFADGANFGSVTSAHDGRRLQLGGKFSF